MAFDHCLSYALIVFGGASFTGGFSSGFSGFSGKALPNTAHKRLFEKAAAERLYERSCSRFLLDRRVKAPKRDFVIFLSSLGF